MHFKIKLIYPIMKKTLFILMVAVGLGSCCNNTKNTSTATVTDSISAAGAISVDSFLVVAPEFLGKELTVSGTVDHVCKHGGKRVKLMGESPSNFIHGEATEGMGAFNAEMEGSTVCLTGMVAESKMDLAYVEEYEKSVKEAMESSKSEAEMEHAKGIDHHAQLEQIAKWKEEIASNGKGYISNYYLEVSKFNVCKTDSQKPCCSHAKADSAIAVSVPCGKADETPCGDKKEHEGCGGKN
ncbi:MAG TPA: hypothetical protein DCQ26_06350 [Marinilabiliales bacterium]|nr:MAG: hypothetical protein A2W95_04000 [Bacteroidetes bacterium GWA2_40_14]OFZ27395.1 MAG: hypothetical protein A2437_13975 [Bacteroidetes bacterium RIFOXYC2_FULL_40_12]HAM98214.1 hypothetical protein [Marinilabiliales bacterium]